MEHRDRGSLQTFVFLIVAGILVLYGVFQARDLLAGPRIEIEDPINGTVMKESLIEIKGSAKNISYIKLNDGQIFVDDFGVFSEKLIAQPGYNIIRLSAEDKFGRTTEQLIELVYEAPQHEKGDIFGKAEVQLAEEEIINEEEFNEENNE